MTRVPEGVRHRLFTGGVSRTMVLRFLQQVPPDRLVPVCRFTSPSGEFPSKRNKTPVIKRPNEELRSVCESGTLILLGPHRLFRLVVQCGSAVRTFWRETRRSVSGVTLLQSGKKNATVLLSHVIAGSSFQPRKDLTPLTS